MEEKEVQKIIAERAFRQGLLDGVNKCARVALKLINDPDLLENVIRNFAILSTEITEASVEVEVNGLSVATNCSSDSQSTRRIKNE